MPRGIRAQGQGEPPPSQGSTGAPETPGLGGPVAGDGPLPRCVEGRLFAPRILSLDFKTLGSSWRIRARKRVRTPRGRAEILDRTSRRTGKPGSREAGVSGRSAHVGAASLGEPCGRSFSELLKDVEDNSSKKTKQMRHV